MLNITVNSPHKSIRPTSFTLPSFSILTGANGSGKTHLLEAIQRTTVNDVLLNGNKLTSVKYIPFNGLNPAIEPSANPASLTKLAKDMYTYHTKILQSGGVVLTGEYLKRIEQRSIPTDGDSRNLQRFAKSILEKSRKQPSELSEEDFLDYYDPSVSTDGELFKAEFAAIFKKYHRSLEQNGYKRYKNVTNKDVSFLTDAEFVEIFGEAPWDFVNSILSEAQIPYHVNSPEGDNLDANFHFKLIDTATQLEINAVDLSTGEKVLMSLALAIYNSSKESSRPQLLMLDEPDAPLHPSMSKKILEIIQTHIVGKAGIPVIITSHSPTTVISAPAESVYFMERGNPSPQSTSVRQAVEMLSADMPYLRVTSDNRRTVFVESKLDVQYFEELVFIQNTREKMLTEPLFLPASTSHGSNSADVIRAVDQLSSHGNDQIYGIVDWDLKNKSTPHLKILGDGERYAIENFVLDPILIGLLLLKEKKFRPDYFGLTSITHSGEIHQISNYDLQNLSYKIVELIGLSSDDLVPTTLNNGWTVMLSRTFCNNNGHDIEARYKDRISEINGCVHKVANENALKMTIINKVIEDHYEFAPAALFDTLKNLR